MKRKLLQIFVAVVVAGGGLYLALRGMDLEQLLAAMRAARWGWLLLSTFLIILGLIFRAQRWRVLLNYRVSLSDAFWLTNIGYLVNNLLPMRLGDPAKGVAAGLRGAISPLAALSTVVVERVLDMLTIVLLMLATLPFILSAGLDDYCSIGLASGGVALAAIVGLAVVARFPAVPERIAAWLLARLRIPQAERWLAWLHQLLEGLAPLRSPRQGALIVLWSLVHWLCVAAYFQVGLYAFMDAPPALGGLLVTWAAALGMMLPSPGGIGAYHTAVIQALTLAYAIPQETAGAFAFVIHGITYFIGIALGAVALLTWGLSFKEVLSGAQTLPSEKG